MGVEVWVLGVDVFVLGCVFGVDRPQQCTLVLFLLGVEVVFLFLFGCGLARAPPFFVFGAWGPCKAPRTCFWGPAGPQKEGWGKKLIDW